LLYSGPITNFDAQEMEISTYKWKLYIWCDNSFFFFHAAFPFSYLFPPSFSVLAKLIPFYSISGGDFWLQNLIKSIKKSERRQTRQKNRLGLVWSLWFNGVQFYLLFSERGNWKIKWFVSSFRLYTVHRTGVGNSGCCSNSKFRFFRLVPYFREGSN
jgi:hypothetical protein